MDARETAELSGGGLFAFSAEQPLELDSGGRIEGLEVAYRTWGALNAER